MSRFLVVVQFDPNGSVLLEIPFGFAQGRLSARW